MVRRRIVECEASLAGAEVAQINVEVAGLLLAFPSANLSDAALQVRARAYHTALEGVPAWALQAAARRWLRGEGDGNNLDFAPSPPRLRKMADAEILPVREHLVQLRRLRDATAERIVRHEERAARAQSMADGAVKRVGGNAAQA
ncbi:hypothetical protein ACLBXM_17885 [Xanthobacteraceae bacterium A53D]